MDFGRDSRPNCRYGAGCYQRNPEHKAKFKHPIVNKEKEDENVKENIATEVNSEPKKRPISEESSDDASKKIRHDMSSTEDSSDADTDNDLTDITVQETKKEVFKDILPPSPTNPKDAIKQKFLLGMPDDFYNFFNFCMSLNKNNPITVLSSVGLSLGGPFEVLAGTIPPSAPRSKQLFLAHHRHYYDPPEFQTVLVESKYKTGLHLGYFRDSPNDLPVFVCSAREAEGPKLIPQGDNLFSGLYNYLATQTDQVDPFTRTKFTSIMEKIKLWVNKTVMEGNDQITLERRTASMKNRDRAKVATTFHGAGMVVPYNRKTEVGYREIPETSANLKKIIKNVVEAEKGPEQDRAMDTLQELVTNVQFANDEGDPGMGLELGIDLLCQDQGISTVLHGTIAHLLGVSYELLDRDLFTEILTAHLARRSKGGADSFANWRDSNSS